MAMAVSGGGGTLWISSLSRVHPAVERLLTKRTVLVLGFGLIAKRDVMREMNGAIHSDSLKLPKIILANSPVSNQRFLNNARERR
jgi:hypothetical protein